MSVRLNLSFAILALALAACASPEKNGQEQPPEEEALSPPKAGPSRSGSSLDNLPRVTMLPPERAMRSGLSGPDAPGPERLIGLTAADIQKMLGQPDFKRHDPPAEIWQYRKDGCLLDLFLYQGENGGGGYRVRHVEARGRSIAGVSGTECLLEALAR